MSEYSGIITVEENFKFQLGKNYTNSVDCIFPVLIPLILSAMETHQKIKSTPENYSFLNILVFVGLKKKKKKTWPKISIGCPAS